MCSNISTVKARQVKTETYENQDPTQGRCKGELWNPAVGEDWVFCPHQKGKPEHPDPCKLESLGNTKCAVNLWNGKMGQRLVPES